MTSCAVEGCSNPRSRHTARGLCDRCYARARAGRPVSPARIRTVTAWVWTEDRVELALSLWTEGRTAAQIGALLGTSRGAVLGKIARSVGRHGRLPRPANLSKPPPVRLATLKAAQERPTEAPAPVTVAPTAAKPLVHRMSGECTWIVSGSGADSLYCCGPVKPGRSWCPAHMAIGTVRAKVAA